MYLPQSNEALPPHIALLQLMTGYWPAQAVYIAAKLGLADHLAGGPMSATDLAQATNAHPSSLQRLLRALASIGVFSEVTPGYFGLTPMAALLGSAPPGSLRALAITYNEELYRAWAEMLHSIQTGQPAFSHVFGIGPFDYFAQHPEPAQIFNEAMVGYTHQVASAVANIYDFAPFDTIADIGGGYGILLATILQRNLNAHGLLFDLPQVVSEAESFLAAQGVLDRCMRTGGDFFVAVPPNADVYLLSQILHDWDDARSLVILEQCRRAIPPHGKLLVVETVIPEGNQPSFGKWLDLHMLAITGGCERTEAEYRSLFRSAGFELVRIIPTIAGPSIIEAKPV